MQIIVTGAAGFVGSNLCSKLLGEGHSVIGIDNFSYGTKNNISALFSHSNFNFIESDLRNSKCLSKLSAEHLIHLASQKIPRYKNSLETLEDNSSMLRNVIEFCKIKKCKLFYASTSDVYGKNTVYPFTEESNLVLGATTVKRWAYAVSKIYGEHSIIANSEEFELDYTIMRFFGSYGPNQNKTWWGGPQSIFIQNVLENKKLEIHGDGEQKRTFTYIDDLVDGIFKCIVNHSSTNQIFNIAGKPEEEISILNLAKLVLELMGIKNTNDHITYIPYSKFGNYEDVSRRVPDISKIKNTLGYNPLYTLREGLIKTIEWQKNN